MCGIAGWLGNIDTETYAARMVHDLHHRGPDAHGIRSWPDATLVHTRLSIIDLSSTGAQPMANEDGTVWTVLNGEIYNHRDLRRGLETRGHRFRGRSDTEVIPHLYEEMGASFVTKLRGMFALAVYDTRKRILILARDRFGIKPLFYSHQKNGLVFASEIRALLQFPGIDKRPDRQAIYDFAALFYIPAPETFFKGIRSLQPGEILEARHDSAGIVYSTRNYHRWTIAPDPKLNISKATDQAAGLISQAVRRQMESDVPLGALLSGGIDSSLVCVAAQEAQGGLRTFNVRFPDRDYDETQAAVTVANHVGTSHETLEMTDIAGTWDHITGLLLHAGQPFADTSLFAVNAICRRMRKHVTVALSGDGGDEAFGGYRQYWQLNEISTLQRLPASCWDMAAAIMDPLARFRILSKHLPARVRAFSRSDNIALVQHLFVNLPDYEHRLLCRDENMLPLRRLFEQKWEHQLLPRTSRLERLSALATEVNSRLVLASDFLYKVDIASMKESLEVRVPLLDEELFAFALQLPHRLKVTGRTGKRVLREVARRKLPQSIAANPKHGFRIPVDKWATTDFKTSLKDVLLGPSSKLTEFFRPEAYRPIIQAFCDESPHSAMSRQAAYTRTIMLLAVHLALDYGQGGCDPARPLQTPIFTKSHLLDSTAN